MPSLMNGQRPAKVAALLRLASFFVLLALAVYGYHGQDLMPGASGVPLTAPLNVVAEHFGASDYATYAKGAVVLRDQGVRAYADLGFKNFAPGVSFVERVLLSFSQNAPLPLCLLILTLILWAWALAFFAETLTKTSGLSPVISNFVAASIVAAPFFHGALLWDGVLISESLSTPFFVLGFLLAFRLLARIDRPTGARLLLTASAFVSAAYLRAQFDLLFLFFVLLLGGAKAVGLLAARLGFARGGRVSSKIGKSVLIVFVLYLGLTVPYRVVVGSPFMVVNDYVWKMVWHDHAYFEQNGGGFILSGGGGVLCETAPDVCQSFMERENTNSKVSFREARLAALATVATHPLSFFAAKLPYFYDNWMGDFTACPQDKGCEARDFNRPMLLFFPFAVLGLMLAAAKRARFLGLYLFVFTGVALGSVGFSIFIHVEPRYMLPIKVLMFWSEAALVGVLLERTRGFLLKAPAKESVVSAQPN